VDINYKDLKMSIAGGIIIGFLGLEAINFILIASGLSHLFGR
jgi:hypothetical protein